MPPGSLHPLQRRCLCCHPECPATRQPPATHTSSRLVLQTKHQGLTKGGVKARQLGQASSARPPVIGCALDRQAHHSCLHKGPAVGFPTRHGDTEGTGLGKCCSPLAPAQLRHSLAARWVDGGQLERRAVVAHAVVDHQILAAPPDPLTHRRQGEVPGHRVAVAAAGQGGGGAGGEGWQADARRRVQRRERPAKRGRTAASTAWWSAEQQRPPTPCCAAVRALPRVLT